MEIEEPLPEWAESLNKDKALIRGTQLQTKDSSRTGNARITDVEWGGDLGYLFFIRTDMGNEFKYTLGEVHSQFNIGPFIIKESELNKRKIVLQTCNGCPYHDHRGGFGSPAYVPICRMAGKELPYTVGANRSGTGCVANGTDVIPVWCPLDKD